MKSKILRRNQGLSVDPDWKEYAKGGPDPESENSTKIAESRNQRIPRFKLSFEIDYFVTAVSPDADVFCVKLSLSSSTET